MRRASIVVLLAGIVVACLADRSAWSQVAVARRASSFEVWQCNPFEDCMVKDTNGDGIADAVAGKIVVPDNSSAVENAAAANLAARIGYETTGITLPIVVPVSKDANAERHVWISSAFPEDVKRQISEVIPEFDPGEGGVFEIGGTDLAILAKDDAGLLAASEAFSSRAPYQWKVPGDKLSAITDAVNSASHSWSVKLCGITYLKGQPGIRRAIVETESNAAAADYAGVFTAGHMAAVRELVILGATTISVKNPKPLSAAATPAPGDSASEPPGSSGADSTANSTANSSTGSGGAAAGAEPTKRLDLATLYTNRGLFTGSAKMPVPSSSDVKLYVPAGAAGIAMANFAARLGLGTTGLTLPIAAPASDATARQVKTQTVIAGDSPLAKDAERKLSSGDTTWQQAESALANGEGEARIVDDAFEKHTAVLVKGDAAGSAAALDLLSAHFPNIWETGKQYLSLEEIRYDLHRFFSLRSGAGQAAAALYHLDQWSKEIASANAPWSDARSLKAEVYVDLADPGLRDFVRREIQKWLSIKDTDVVVESLRAGTQCCDKDPNLHFEEPGYPFHQGAPTFSEDFVIPWEGNRLLEAAKRAALKIKSGAPVNLIARVSEGPEERQKLTADLENIFTKAGADRNQLHVEVLCAYKQGYSWLMDEIAPALAGKNVASIAIDFAKDVDVSGVRAMFSPARWVQELYPVDEMLSRKLNIPLKEIRLNEIDDSAPQGPTYRIRALDTAGKEILNREFRVTTAMQPYNGVMPRYEQVEVETGWLHIESGKQTLLDQRIKTDIELYWDHYQNVVLPRVYQFVMAQAHGDLRQEFAPPFDTLKLDIHLSEPDYSLGLDKERISSLEAIQEDTFYSTDNFINMMGDLETGRPISYIGRVIPIVHASEDGKDGRVHIEFYGKLAANPLVRLTWTDSQGKHHERERNLPALTGDTSPRLIQARANAGADGVESLTWLLPADYLDDKYNDWLNVDGQDSVDRSIFSVAQARGQLSALEEMHSAGLYRDELAYPHLQRMAMEFELPPSLTAKENAPAERAYASWSISAPATPRPMIADYAAASTTHSTTAPIVQWDEPISPAENAAILAQFATRPGVTVYWMGRSYLGNNIWAADVMLPSPSTLRSSAKETTLKASIIYSGRQHANEVSSTSHIDKLGEELLTDPAIRAALNKVNVVLHPIDNTDGAQLSVDLAKITPDNLLHPGYHGSLSADVSAGQADVDPVYPESRTRGRLIAAWLPDAFLNPHGYPSHEWVQPFSEYTGWAQTREGANPGRAWWIPRGWFTSLAYLRDPDHPESMRVTYALRDQIVEAERNVPGLLDLENRMNDRYERFGQRWQPRDMFQPIVNGIRIYMALKGSPARPAAGGAGVAPGSGGVGGISPDITWDSGYTEAPDETAHGDYMKLMASAGLAFDHVHLNYLANGKLRITRTEKEVPGGVQWRVERARPILPPDK